MTQDTNTAHITLASDLNSQFADLQAAEKGVVDKRFAFGEALIRAKAEVGHGNWLPFVVQHLNINSRQASKYMYIAEHRTKIEHLMANRHAHADLQEQSIEDMIHLVHCRPVADDKLERTLARTGKLPLRAEDKELIEISGEAEKLIGKAHSVLSIARPRRDLDAGVRHIAEQLENCSRHLHLLALSVLDHETYSREVSKLADVDIA